MSQIKRCDHCEMCSDALDAEGYSRTSVVNWIQVNTSDMCSWECIRDFAVAKLKREESLEAFYAEMASRREQEEAV